MRKSIKRKSRSSTKLRKSIIHIILHMMRMEFWLYLIPKQDSLDHFFISDQVLLNDLYSLQKCLLGTNRTRCFYNKQEGLVR